MSNEQGSWEIKRLRDVKVGDETLINGVWTMVTAVGHPDRHGQHLYFGAGSVFYPHHTEIMIKEK